MRVKISNDNFRYLNAFSRLTGVGATDCFEFGSEIVYVVESGKISVAVGKKGMNIKKVEALIKKRIRLVEFSSDPSQFIKNIIFPKKPKNIYIATKSSGERVINLQADHQLRKTLTREGKKLQRLISLLLGRHFPEYVLEVIE
ncbi:MAG: NusA-like transcription termination signal-binding factor [Candidatus Altiarchaeota archaeon]|nr:NusA-like transcription termination signal-binding factor [Candidatus Altiarchaeota archaeon]